ncbi:MAG: cation:proton antiporter domain-containing protein [Limisphaerales bacterium]
MAICIVVAWLLALVAQGLKQPLILAYLLAGFAIGPVGTGLVGREATIETISQLGLILLLFMIGLEIDVKKILSAARTITLTAIAQICGGCVLGVLFFRAVGFPGRGGRLDALYLAVAATLSSTVIIVKVLYDKRELDTLPGRLTLAVLVLQDLFAILFLALQPNLTGAAAGLLALSLGKVVLLVAVAFTASRYALPPVFHAVARMPELVLVGSLAWCFLIAGLASVLGLSREMGALVAGVAISTFPYTLDVTAKVTSLRDFFVTLFFVALGMKIPAPTLYLLKWAVVFALFVVASRCLTVFTPLYAMRLGHRASLLPAINLSQVSEFSLVILALGLQLQHVAKESVGIVAYAFVFLGVVSTYAMTKSDALMTIASRWLKRFGLPDLDQPPETASPPPPPPKIFLLGFFWTASSLLEEITRTDPALLNELAVIDFNPQVNQELRARGVRIIYGDISQRDTLLHAGLAQAEIIVCTLPNSVLKGTNNLRLLQLMRKVNPIAQIIVHAELFADVPRLYAAGASYVFVPRLIEASNLCALLQAARRHALDRERAALDRELANRSEVIP